MTPSPAPAAATNAMEVRLSGGMLALNRLLMTLQNKRMPVADIGVEGNRDGTRVSVSLDCPEENARRYATVLEGLEDVEDVRFSEGAPDTPSDAPVSVERLDHLVLTVADPDRTTAFYERVLGMEGVVFGEGRRALAFAGGKINLHRAGHEFEPKAGSPTPGSADLCFVVEQEMATVVGHLGSAGVEILQGPVGRTGAFGQMTSVYIRDPDGNLIELSRYEGNAPRERGR